MAGLYRGACITLLRDIPAHAIYFTSYELCHELFEPGSRLTGVHSPAALFLSGEPHPCGTRPGLPANEPALLNGSACSLLSPASSIGRVVFAQLAQMRAFMLSSGMELNSGLC